MPVTQQDYEKVCVLNVVGDFAGEEPAAAQQLVSEGIADRQVVDFVVNFHECSFIDSQGLETLLWVKRRCEELFGRVKLINVDENCRKILEMTRLEPRFECCRDLATALKTMR